MILALALMNILPIPVSTVVGQTNSNNASSLAPAPITNANSPTSTSATEPLKIVVPVRGFGDFVKVTGENVSGFSIEVFEAVVAALPKPFPYKLIGFVKPDGTLNGTFDDMLRAVFSEKYDGAVGDISIVSYRTEWVDFSLPYMETGISMLVPSQQQQQAYKTTRIPVSKVTKGFVAATLAFSFVVALLFWVVEHRNDKYASQPQPTNMYSSAAQCSDDWRREILRSVIQTRLVMVLFFMVLLVLIACYAASQTTSLSETRRRASASIKNLNQLIRMGANVGYQQGSFVKNLLLNKGFSESKLIPFNTGEEMYDLLSKRGVAAVVGLTPHLQLRRTGHCDALAVVPTFSLQNAGLGFAFRKRSPIVVRDMSNRILKLIDNGKMRRIQERTIGSLEKCPDDQNAGNTSDLTDTDTLRILVVGAIGVLLLMIIVMLVHCGMTCSPTRKKEAVAYPCYVLPCC